MADMMTFPDTVEEFMEEYKLVDTEQVYTNGMELVPIFRMKQWFEHEKAQLSCEGITSDLISKTETVEHLRRVLDATVPITDYDEGYVDGVEFGISTVSTMPTVQPEPKEGYWIEISSINHTYKCSECGRLLVNVADGRNNVSKHYPYCHCGADMKGVSNE